MPIPLSPQHSFVQQPREQDYYTLAQHIDDAAQDRLYSVLRPRRDQVIQSLRRMGAEPQIETHRAAYQALRLLVW